LGSSPVITSIFGLARFESTESSSSCSPSWGSKFSFGFDLVFCLTGFARGGVDFASLTQLPGRILTFVEDNHKSIAICDFPDEECTCGIPQNRSTSSTAMIEELSTPPTQFASAMARRTASVGVAACATEVSKSLAARQSPSEPSTAPKRKSSFVYIWMRNSSAVLPLSPIA
jgi:hypothetical protein